MNIGGHTFGVGALIALVVLVVTLVIWIAETELDRNKILALIAGLAIARLVP